MRKYRPYRYRQMKRTEATSKLDAELDTNALRGDNTGIDFYNAQHFLDFEDKNYWQHWPGALIDQTMQWCLFPE